MHFVFFILAWAASVPRRCFLLLNAWTHTVFDIIISTLFVILSSSSLLSLLKLLFSLCTRRQQLFSHDVDLRLSNHIYSDVSLWRLLTNQVADPILYVSFTNHLLYRYFVSVVKVRCEKKAVSLILNKKHTPLFNSRKNMYYLLTRWHFDKPKSNGNNDFFNNCLFLLHQVDYKESKKG